MASLIGTHTPLVNSVESELNKARNSLRQLDEEIRVLTGRGVDEFGGNSNDFGKGTRLRAGGGSNRPPISAIGQKRRISAHGDSYNDDNEDGTWKRSRISSEYSRTSRFDQDATMNEPAVQSSVTMPLKETKSRADAITELKGNEAREVANRNRRMFGVLLGTLKKFKKDEEKHTFKDQEKKQKEIETRLEEERRKERMQIEQERLKLLEKRRVQERDIRRLQRKRALIAATDNQISLLRRLQTFIQTTTKPPIFFMPVKHTIRTIELQKKSQKKLEEAIKAKQEEADLELKRMDEDILRTQDDDEEEQEDACTHTQIISNVDQPSDDVTEGGVVDSVECVPQPEAKKEEAEKESAQPMDIQDELKELAGGYAEDLNFEEDDQQR